MELPPGITKISGKGQSGQSLKHETKAQEIWENILKQDEYIKRKINIDLPSQLGIESEKKLMG